MWPVTPADADFFCALYADPDTMRFVGSPLPPERALRSFGIILASQAARPVRRRFLLIVEKVSQRSIGFSAFQRFDLRNRRVEAGMVLNSESRGRGFGKEGLRALVSHAFESYPVDEVWIQHAADHMAASRVPAGVGLLPRADAPAYGAAPGRCVWSAHRSRWLPNTQSQAYAP